MADNRQGFASWYEQRHGYQPFPWQAALATKIAAGNWPEALTPPTGSGKTAVIDIWLWARQQGRPVPRRLVYVIDRRLVVDGVTAYATALAATLDEHERPAVVTMRGGMTIDDVWLSNPLRLAVIVSTVDQVGSRLLFSGYGISPKTASIHAGLLGNDALFVVDEVHLVRPLLQTLASIATQRGSALPLPWHVLPMSATWAGANTHGLTDADWTHPVLSRRLKAAKPARLIKLPADGADLPRTLADEALRLRREGAEVVAVVCNRVDRARTVFEHLNSHGQAVLLTGRIRPGDKAVLTDEYLPRMAVGSRGHRDPLFVVATQTIEVGADLDMDALVTECASLSALRQRAGRLNRLGELASASMAIVYQTPLKKSDPIYGEDIERTWKWLNAVAAGSPKTVDFGIAAMMHLMAQQPPPDEDAQETLALLPAHVDMLSQTSVRHGINVAPWLHGWKSGSADVYLCWRADYAKASVEAAPPAQQELLAVPLYALHRWSAEIADVEGGESAQRDHGKDRVCIRWDGEEALEISTGAARAGDTLVLPAIAGGADRYGWAPRSTMAVSDVGDTVRRVRLHPAVHPEWAEEIRALLGDEDAGDPAWQELARRSKVLDGNPGRVLAYPGGCVVLRTTESTSQSALRKVALRDHQQAVGARAATLAQGSGLDHELVEAVRRAGAGHDTGKQDRRWQAMVGGDGSLLLAKGPGGDTRWISLPRGWRHEMASAVHQNNPLVRHLVGSHHGHGRPILPAAPDIALWRQLDGWAESAAELQRTYGPWGLAYLEALVRLADWSVSAEEQA
ncbi:type I-U CRISPR-associated helicase/endonuclease Cas3 [Accumulibacter sp.]|uniref:type I-G CRISPR-associated helicase/endonuclease Cas3g n=1 Tax=Accumulibacter sp. TaxID=2053492 RepID=UPI001AC640C5|nr:type I-U CRISPR-associated helicase/endonuclease Cas3 [Accumulibacter sp.]MBN8514521.1 type I-U CRISPR-associated helicase/endonuclease Cas3 [Accumulibacter sp.]MBO3702453.1 type I-U CRISPR-associated helicase/endonuclease Cas3 [Accumulibacter sp.]